MKLLLVFSLLLLLSLASAEPAPYAKVLFDDGYVLSEADELNHLSVQYNRNLFTILLTGKTSESSDSMNLKRNLLKGSGGFAVEAYLPESNLKTGDGICKKNSRQRLQPLIETCFRNTKLRMLTAEEKDQIEQYKKDQRASGKPFEVVYKEGRTTIKSTEINGLHYWDTVASLYYRSLDFFATIHKDDEKAHRMNLKHGPYSSFVIEGLPAWNNEKCGMDRVDLKMIFCQGKVKVRRAY